MSNKLTNCKACGQEVAVSAKHCPHCGAKVKKPFYQKPWFWVVVVLMVMAMVPKNTGTAPSAKPAAASSQQVSSATSAPSAKPAAAASSQQVSSAPSASQAKAAAASSQQVSSAPSASQTEPAATPAASYSSKEFRAACDDYEKFIDQYCDLMKAIEKNPSDMELAMKLIDMESSLLRWEQKMEKLNDYDLTDEDARYLAEVELRCSGKLLKAAQ